MTREYRSTPLITSRRDGIMAEGAGKPNAGSVDIKRQFRLGKKGTTCKYVCKPRTIQTRLTWRIVCRRMRIRPNGLVQ